MQRNAHLKLKTDPPFNPSTSSGSIVLLERSTTFAFRLTHSFAIASPSPCVPPKHIFYFISWISIIAIINYYKDLINETCIERAWVTNKPVANQNSWLLTFDANNSFFYTKQALIIPKFIPIILHYLLSPQFCLLEAAFSV